MKQIALSLFVIASSGAYVWDQAGKGPAGDMIDTAGSANAAEDSVAQPPAPASPVQTDPTPAPPPPSPGIRQQSARLDPPATTPTSVGGETTAAISAPAPKQQQATKPPLSASSPQLSQAPAAQPEQASAQTVADAAPRTASFTITPAVYIPIPQPRPDYPQAHARVFKAAMKLAVSPGTKPAGHGFADGTYTGPAADAYYGLIQIQASIQGGRLTALKVLKYPNDRRTSISINRQALPMLRDEAIRAQSADVDIISGATLTSRAFIQSLGGALKKASS
ncbi:MULTISPECIES: FMN-binding protein [unclassified Mesorhizobium]|uniref:FMN-binding protein n=1 Tax=unclassified Mesorhizobium TaxID=325217 RepID=UPI000BAFB251|nr:MULTISPECIES: FMN-binding protein [unclassified Mesorhizobium]PBB25486.1 FMN-binding domain-containing protein [Mesorhizobium sp. WSM4304]PBB75082.1 FMN-binding domain-containing protein [Mesorhizobium sp. WSM4308]